MQKSISLFLALTYTVAQASVFEYGNAIYAYAPLHCTPDACEVVPSRNKAAWKDDIEHFNSNCTDGVKNCKIEVVNSYGGDIEFWASKDSPDACSAPASTNLSKCNVSAYFDSNNAKAAEAYKNAEGVKAITALLDGRLDGMDQINTYDKFDNCSFGNFYPNLQNLTQTSLKRLANDTATLYCKEPSVSGIQVDLEPFHGQYVQPMTDFIGYLSEFLRDENETVGCRNDNFTEGRAVSYFCFAHDQNETFNKALGENGYYVFSLYDLDPKPEAGGFMYNTPAEFAQRMRAEIPHIRRVVGNTQKFQIALPAGASCHEYETYAPMNGTGCGPSCDKIENKNYTMKDYVQAAFDVLLDPKITEDTEGLFCLDEEGGSQFLGISWWSFSYQMTYPPMKWFDNEFLPAAPPADALALIRKYAPKLADGTTTCKSSSSEVVAEMM